MCDRPERLTQPELEALRQSVAHATIADLGAAWKADADPEHVRIVGDYLHHFAARKRQDGDLHPRNPCLRCGGALHGSIVDALLSQNEGFAWGLAHGSGFCRNCGWPATLYHTIKDADGTELLSCHSVVLQIHPDEIEIRKD